MNLRLWVGWGRGGGVGREDYGYGGRGGGEGRIDWESGIDMHTMLYLK